MSDNNSLKHFDDLLHRDNARRLLEEGTGRGVRIALLDSGVDINHPAFANASIETHRVARRSGRTQRLQCVPDKGGDPVGHGTACAGILHNMAPDAELVSVQVLGRDASGAIDQLLTGLAWAIEQDVDVINLSLGTVQRTQVARLHDLIDRAYYRDKIVVAAANNHKKVSFPANFASLIAVDSQHFKDPVDFHYRLGHPVEIEANGIYVKAPTPGSGYRWYTGTSFACPHIAGLVARLRSSLPSLTPFQAKTLLWTLRTQSDAENDGAESDDGAELEQG